MSQHNLQESVLPPPFLQVKNRFFSKSAPGKISLSMVLILQTYELGKTAKKTTVMSISPYIGCQTEVREPQYLCGGGVLFRGGCGDDGYDDARNRDGHGDARNRGDDGSHDRGGDARGESDGGAHGDGVRGDCGDGDDANRGGDGGGRGVNGASDGDVRNDGGCDGYDGGGRVLAFQLRWGWRLYFLQD